MSAVSVTVVLLWWTSVMTGSHGQLLESEQLSECKQALGMHSGDIPDSAITASSSYDEKSVGPLNARIRTERNGGAWCPKFQISKDVFEWLEVDLGNLTVVSHVETQGRFGNGQGQEYAPAYLVEYQREDGSRWIRHKNRQGKEIIDGNTDTYTTVMRDIRPPIITRRLRFIPYSLRPRTICMRVEVYGCPWTDGLLSYSVRQGDTRGSEVDFFDFTYDGTEEDSWLSGGLGQLVDLEEGDTTFRYDKYSIGKKGYEWVAWKNDTLATPPVTFLFAFDTVRNFSSVTLHTNNLFSKEIQIFRKAKAYFSIGGSYFLEEPLMFEYLQDNLIEYARPVTIPVPSRLGKFIKLELFFADRWIMISEIRFENEIAVGEFVQEIPPPVTPRPVFVGPVVPESTETEVKPTPIQVDTKEADGATEPAPPSEHKKDNTYIGVIIGALSAFIIILAVIMTAVFARQRRKKLKYSGSPLKLFIGHDHINFNMSDVPSDKVCNGNVYKGVATEDSDSVGKDSSLTKLTQVLNNDVSTHSRDQPIQTRRLPEPPSGGNLCAQVGPEYACTDITQYSNLVVNLPPQPIFNSSQPATKESSSQPPTPPPHPLPQAMCTAVGSSPDFNIQGLVGNSVYAVPSTEWFHQDLSLTQFPKENLRFLEKLGEGQFGEVHLCEALDMGDQLGEAFLLNRCTNTDSVLVAVKVLRPEACPNARRDFQKEINIMARLKDPNVVHVLGVCGPEEAQAVVVEYMKYGDLNQFLLQHVPESTLSSNHHTLSYGTLIYMATQIASGMKYLETLNMVHRDLASRNCLVGTNYTVKISDFGMSRSLYSRDYYRIEGKAVLPIRWMAWESVLLGKFSAKSDVWSFAVTLWEILIFAREQPYMGMNDEQVIENFGHYYRDNGQEVCLPMPSICPKEIFDLMRECWNRDELQRPSFREIHMFLQRKNMGYNPAEEGQAMMDRK